MDAPAEPGPPHRGGRRFRLGAIWRQIAKWSKRLETIAKPVTYLLASLALLSVYFPDLMRFWEEQAMPSAWYQVGTLRLSVGKDANRRQAVLMNGGHYDAAAWNDGIRLHELFELPGQDIRTDGTVVGRRLPTLRSSVKAVLVVNQCLHARDVSFATFRPQYARGDTRGSGQQREVLLSEMSQADRKDADGTLRARFGNPATCQPLTADEAARAEKAAGEAKQKWEYPYDSKAPVCPRIAIWVKAAKVSC